MTHADGLPAPPPPGAEGYSTGQVARLLGVSRNAVIRWCDRGELRAWLLPGGPRGPHRRVRRADLEDFVRRRRVATFPGDPGVDGCRPPLPRRGEDFFSTGDVARLAGCAVHTVAKWVDSGRLRGYRLPSGEGAKDRRVLRADLLEFARREGVRPLLAALEPPCEPARPGARPPGPVALCGLDDALAGRLAALLGGVARYPDLFALGLAFARTSPPRAVVLGGCHGRAAALEAVRALVGLDPRPLLVGLPGEDDDGLDAWTAAGCDRVFQVPCDPKRVMEVLT
jgi:excisionase family DNA binding protein